MEDEPWYKRPAWWVAVVAFTLMLVAAGFLTYRLLRSQRRVLALRVFDWGSKKEDPVTPQALEECAYMLDMDAGQKKQLYDMARNPYAAKNLCAQQAQQMLWGL
jgi:hypothetical protein